MALEPPARSVLGSLPLQLDGVDLIGFNSQTAGRLLLTAGVIAAVIAIRALVVGAVRLATKVSGSRRVLFWTRQGASLAALAIVVLATLAIWFDNASSLGTAAGFATAGLAIAAQRAVTAFAAYLIIIRGKTFTVGDRIKMGGVQGDVIALGFLQTRILEMGQPPAVDEQEEPGMWVRARQFTGRVVTVTNDRLFDEAVYNFTRELPFIWEEITLPVPYRADRSRAERILLDAAIAGTAGHAEASVRAAAAFESKYHVRLDSEQPRVFWRLTDNWLEMTVRFIVPEHGVREIKDTMARRILKELDAAGIEVASATYEIVGLPTLRIARAPRSGE